MDLFTLFLTKLAQPLIVFCNGCFNLLIKADKWWTKKTEATRVNIRWIIFTVILISLWTVKETENANANIINNNRTAVGFRLRDAKIERLEQWKIARLQGEILDLKTAIQKALETEKEIERLKSKK